MPEGLETVLRLVADGTLTPEEAAPIIEALGRTAPSPRTGATDAPADEDPSGRGGRRLRIRVTEHGRQIVNLRIPIGFVDGALDFVPGLGGEQSRRIREAVKAGTVGPIVDVEEADGSGVLISVE